MKNSDINFFFTITVYSKYLEGHKKSCPVLHLQITNSKFEHEIQNHLPK